MKKVIGYFLIASLVCVLLFPLAVIEYLNHGNPIMKTLLKNEAAAHLNKEGYTKKDIKKTFVSWNTEVIKGTYDTKYYVTFKDEQRVIYTYIKKKQGGAIAQLCGAEEIVNGTSYTAYKPAHRERACFHGSYGR